MSWRIRDCKDGGILSTVNKKIRGKRTLFISTGMNKALRQC